MFTTPRNYRPGLAGLAVAVCSLIIFGCAGTRSSRPGNGDQQNTTAVLANNEATVLASASSAARPEYRIGILDELEIRVRYHDRLNGILKVRPDGRITLEDIGDVYVSEMTPSELDSFITKAYSTIVHAPEVTIIVRSFAGLAIYVLGEVDRPGIVELKPKMTALQAITAASGPIRGANLSSVILLRRDLAGAMKATRLNLKRSRIKGGTYQDMYIQPEDIVYVPKTFIANVNDFLTQVYDGLFPPFDIYLRALREYSRNPR
ncbi:MAG: polysaccharide biosynthesis/export family protein [bacterium]